MAESTILRETKIGQKGFVKEDVMTYIDELNSKIVSLEDEIKKGSPATPVDQQEIIKYRNQIDNLQEKLNASNNALRAAKKEVEELQKRHDTDLKLIEQLKAGGPGAAAAAAQSNAQTAAALEAAKKEIERLNAQLKEAQAKAAEAAKAPAQAAPAQAEQAANNAELAKTKQEISRLTSELGSKAKEIAERDKTIAQITKDKDDAAAQLKNKDAEIAKLNGEITSLNGEITTLKESASDPTAQMGLIFAEAQKTVNMLKTQAKTDADKTIADATEKADAILREEFDNCGLAEKVWQYFISVPDFKSVGVKDDKRYEGWPAIIRAVNTTDAMTATIEEIPYKLLHKITARITSEVPGINRVVYDLTPKPIGTIEWE